MPNLLDRFGVCLSLLTGLRRHDFRAARTWIRMMYAGSHSLPVAVVKFIGWALGQMLGEIPTAMRDTTWAPKVSKTPFWLAQGNPLENHPWRSNPDAGLPESAHVVVIGAGFTGGSLAYHWSKNAPAESKMVVLEMGDAADGSSGRNEGLVVMGRFYSYVHKTVLKHLAVVRCDLSAGKRDQMACQFAATYVRAAYKNADLIEQTIREEGFDCGYVRAGWVQAQGQERQRDLATSVRRAVETGFTDWTQILHHCRHGRVGNRGVVQRRAMRGEPHLGKQRRAGRLPAGVLQPHAAPRPAEPRMAQASPICANLTEDGSWNPGLTAK